jgi:hypothetical protein
MEPATARPTLSGRVATKLLWVNKPVEPDRHAETREVVEADGDQRVYRAQPATPRRRDRGNEANERDHGDDQDRSLLPLRAVGTDRFDPGYGGPGARACECGGGIQGPLLPVAGALAAAPERVSAGSDVRIGSAVRFA